MDNVKNLKIVSDKDLKDWAKEIFKKNSFKMIDVSEKKETFRRALASGKIYVGDDVFELIKNKKMPKGDPITLAEVSAVLGVKKTSELKTSFPSVLKRPKIKVVFLFFKILLLMLDNNFISLGIDPSKLVSGQINILFLFLKVS